MLMLQLIGNNIQKKYGSKYVWGLYLSGAIAGSLAMYFWMPFYPISIPKVGAEPSISALFSFYSILNPKTRISFLFIPFKVWFIFGLVIIFTILADPSRKNISGILIGGVIAHMLRRRLI
jgi:membrane associated rhomboid family serine protease